MEPLSHRDPSVDSLLYVANLISLDTTANPGLTQVLLWTSTGLFDFKAQQAAGSVTVTNTQAKNAIKALKHPVTGLPYVKES